METLYGTSLGVDACITVFVPTSKERVGYTKFYSYVVVIFGNIVNGYNNYSLSLPSNYAIAEARPEVYSPDLVSVVQL